MRFLVVLLAAIAGYLAFAFGGGFLIETFSANRHDRSLEAAMTGAFVLGPIGAVLAAVVALAVLRRRV